MWCYVWFWQWRGAGKTDKIDEREEQDRLLQECGKPITDYLQGFIDGKQQALNEFKRLIKLNCHCKNKEFLLLKLREVKGWKKKLKKF